MARNLSRSHAIFSPVLPSSLCGLSCDGHTKYNATQSSTSTSKDAGDFITLKYTEGGVVVGEEYSDVVFLGGYEVAQ
jgi:hypothetical protein